MPRCVTFEALQPRGTTYAAETSLDHDRLELYRLSINDQYAYE